MPRSSRNPRDGVWPTSVPDTEDIDYLRSPRAIRERAGALLTLVESGRSQHFTIDGARLPAVVDRVLAVTRANHPDLAAIPYHSRWRHFSVGGIDRAAAFDARLAGLPAAEQLRARFELAITSVLLDAGAGASWSFREPGTDITCTRSEGLALASYHMFVAGAFSSAPARTPLRADAAGLEAVTADRLARAFQVGEANPLVGLAGRADLLRRLGAAVRSTPAYFGGDVPRLGNLADFLMGQASGGTLAAPSILAALLEALAPIWPNGAWVDGVGLGDVWAHPQVGMVPFHKLSQWLAYSLCEPLETTGLRVVDLDGLTGLAEYRNGGLFVDAGLLVPRNAKVPAARHPVGSPLVVEWRALTVALLDRTATELRGRLGLDAVSLPLAKVLEGGTWQAGRQIAHEMRPDGRPPIEIESDGTVF